MAKIIINRPGVKAAAKTSTGGAFDISHSDVAGLVAVVRGPCAEGGL